MPAPIINCNFMLLTVIFLHCDNFETSESLCSNWCRILNATKKILIKSWNEISSEYIFFSFQLYFSTLIKVFSISLNLCIRWHFSACHKFPLWNNPQCLGWQCFTTWIQIYQGLPCWLSVKSPPANSGATDTILGLGRFPWRRKWQPNPAFLPGESHGQRSLVGYRPWDYKESDTT